MKYYIILLQYGQVKDLYSYDDEDVRDRYFDKFKDRYSQYYWDGSVQKFNVVN